MAAADPVTIFARRFGQIIAIEANCLAKIGALNADMDGQHNGSTGEGTYRGSRLTVFIVSVTLDPGRA